MKRVFALCVLTTQLLVPAVALAQAVPLVTVGNPTGGQPPKATVTPSASIPAVAIALTAGSSAVSITGITVAKVGSAPDAAVTSVKVYDTENNLLGSVSGFSANHTSTIPITLSVPAGERRTLVVFATVAGDLSAYQGQFFNLNITAITTSAVISGALPIYGAQLSLHSGFAKPTCQITASPSSYTAGQTVTLRWQSSGATGGTITGLGSVGPSGQQGILPGGSGTYTGTFTGAGGTGTCSIIVTKTASGGGVFSPGGVDSAGTVPVASSNSGSGTTLPSPTAPAGTGPGVAQVCTGLDCQMCHFASLGQKVVNWVIGLSIPLAAVMFAWAGIMYFTSATSPDNLNRAKSAFKVAFLGFLIAVTAWLIVQTVLKFTLNPEAYRNWSTITCTNTNLRAGATGNYSNLNNLLGGILGPADISTPRVVVGTGGTSASGGQNYPFGYDTGGSVDPDTGAYLANPSIGPGGACNPGDGYGQDSGDPSSATCLGADGSIYSPTAASNDIAAAAAASFGSPTNMGPENGNKACAWAVNNVLKSQGIAPIDGDSVEQMETQLTTGGRGVYSGSNTDTANTTAGDIVVWKDYKNNTISHVGICLDNGCSKVISNSSSGRAFNSITDAGFNKGVEARIYRVQR